MKVCIYINNTVLEFLTRYCHPKTMLAKKILKTSMSGSTWIWNLEWELHQYDPVRRNINIIARESFDGWKTICATIKIAHRVIAREAWAWYTVRLLSFYHKQRSRHTSELCFTLLILSLTETSHQKLKLQLQNSLHNSTYELK